MIKDGGRAALDHYFHQVANLRVSAGEAATAGPPAPERSRS
jgi:hypothetical protein